MAKSKDKINLIYIPIIYIVYALLAVFNRFGFGRGYAYYRYEEEFFDVLVNSPYVKMFLISFVIAGGIYFFDKKSSFYKLLPLAFLGVVTIQLLMVLFPENIINSFF
tara:strand:+ start:681 stop:1001 length:321 start_codon:yes stop_codon:yes gene_type:complete